MKIFRLSSLLACALLATATFSYAQVNDPVVEKIISLEKESNQTMDHLDVMCNRFGGRLIGSDNYDHAADWAIHMFHKWGLKTEKQYAGEVPVGFNRGPWFGKIINGNEALHFVTPSYTAGTKGVQRGHVVKEPQTTAEFNRIKHTINGAWVLLRGASRGWPVDQSVNGDKARAKIIAKNDSIVKANSELRTINSERAKKRAEIEKKIQNTTSPKQIAKLKAELEEYAAIAPTPLIEEPGLFFKEMKEAGMLGMVQSAKIPLTCLYDRKNLMDLTWETLPTIPDIKLDERQFKKIKDVVDKRESIYLEFEIRNNFYMGPVPFHNVIAYLEGTEHPEEYVICCGHLDCYDAGTGGVDCGTGIAPTMEAARLLAMTGAKPRRTIMFVLWAAEEYGLLGSKYWVEHHLDELPNVVNVFNRDGGPTVANSWSVPQAWYDQVKDICEPLKDLDPRFPFTLKVSDRYPVAVPAHASGTDQAHFNMHGVPTLGFGEGDVLGYDFNYGDIWHTDWDVYTKSIPVYMEHTSLVNAIVLWGVANLKEALPTSAVYKK